MFICLASKAIHSEVASDLTSNAFIAALKRFIARRGKCENLSCDNGTNFVGAKRELQELHDLLNRQDTRQEIVSWCAEDGINFHFITPRSPHHGGIWEAAVTVIKTHLIKTINSSSLTFEELCTVVAEVESIVNSRPSTALSSDPCDLESLTPGHLLIGEPLVGLPEPSLLQLKDKDLTRWQHLCFLKQSFWKRWQREYVLQLQQRYKWSVESRNIEIGTLVLVGDDNLLPQKWLLGRVTELHPGPYKKVRVLSIKTKARVI